MTVFISQLRVELNIQQDLQRRENLRRIALDWIIKMKNKINNPFPPEATPLRCPDCGGVVENDKICHWCIHNKKPIVSYNTNIKTNMKIKTKPKISPALTWDQLAEEYPGCARTKPMEQVFAWAEKQKSKFYVCPKEETIHKILK